MAWMAIRNPDILQAENDDDEPLIYENDAGEEEQVTPEEVLSAYHEHANILQFFHDWHTGIITVTLSDYQALPAVLLDGRRYFEHLRTQKWQK